MKDTEMPQPTQQLTRARRRVAVAVGIAVFALVAVPVFWTAVLAYAGFSGCFFECSDPDP